VVLSPLTTLALGVAMGLCGVYWVGRHYRHRMAILLLEMEDRLVDLVLLARPAQERTSRVARASISTTRTFTRRMTWH